LTGYNKLNLTATGREQAKEAGVKIKELIGEEILSQRKLIKQNTLAMRRQMHYDKQQVKHITY
jgi:bisphosphoglycerate-dependent phosphoglycerate mutase